MSVARWKLHRWIYCSTICSTRFLPGNISIGPLQYSIYLSIIAFLRSYFSTLAVTDMSFSMDDFPNSINLLLGTVIRPAYFTYLYSQSYSVGTPCSSGLSSLPSTRSQAQNLYLLLVSVTRYRYSLVTAMLERTSDSLTTWFCTFNA